MTCNICPLEDTNDCKKCKGAKRMINGVIFETMDKDTKLIADHYGYNKQSEMLIEEMAELTKAIMKHKRKEYDVTLPTYENLIEELADTSLVLDQIVYLLQCESKVAEIKRYKAERTKEGMWGA